MPHGMGTSFAIQTSISDGNSKIVGEPCNTQRHTTHGLNQISELGQERGLWQLYDRLRFHICTPLGLGLYRETRQYVSVPFILY